MSDSKKENNISILEKDISKRQQQISENIHEFKVVASGFEKTMNEHHKKAEILLDKMETSIKNIHNEHFVLQKLPKKMEDSLRSIIPDIAREIEKNYENIIGDFNNHIKTCNDNLIAFSENAKNRIKTSAETAEAALDQVQKKAKIVADSYWKKLMVHVLLTSIIASITAFAVSYMMIEYVPKKIFIDTPRGLVTIDKSEVNIMTNDVRVKPKQHGK